MKNQPADNLSISTRSFTDVVGSWSVSTAAPPPDLANLIAEVWESGGPVTVGHIKLIPRGTVDLIVNLGADQAMYAKGQLKCINVYKRAWISGLFDQPLFVGPDLRNRPVKNHLVAISFFPTAVLSVFGVPAHELVNRVFDAELLLGSSIVTLQEQMSAVATVAQRFQLLLSYIRELKSRLARPAPFSAIWVVNRLQASSGFERIDNLCSEVGISRRQLNRQFIQVAGLGPKAYSRLIRFRAAANYLDNRGTVDLTELSYRFGYCDQAHFSREFKHFAGECPRQYLLNVGADGEAVFIE